MFSFNLAKKICFLFQVSVKQCYCHLQGCKCHQQTCKLFLWDLWYVVKGSLGRPMVRLVPNWNEFLGQAPVTSICQVAAAMRRRRLSCGPTLLSMNVERGHHMCVSRRKLFERFNTFLRQQRGVCQSGGGGDWWRDECIVFYYTVSGNNQLTKVTWYMLDG